MAPKKKKEYNVDKPTNEQANRFKDIKIESRPAGSDPSYNVDITNLSESERRPIQENNRLLGKELAALKANPPIAPPTTTGTPPPLPNGMLPSQAPLPPGIKPPQMLPPSQRAGNLNSGVFPENSTLGKVESSVNTFGENIGAGSRGSLTPGIVGGIAASTAAQFIDGVASIFSARKSADVITAEGALNDAIGKIESDIELVKAGRKNYSEVKLNFERARTSLNRLQGTQKGLGKLNLRYWLGGGAEVEQAILIYNETLEELEQELDIAAQEGRLARTQAMRQQAVLALGQPRQ